MNRSFLVSIASLCLLISSTGCESGGDDSSCPASFSMRAPITGDYDITVSGVWSDGGSATIPNPYPMRSGTVTVTTRGETHTFEFTSTDYHSQHGLHTFTVIIDGTWTCSYHNEDVLR